MWLPLFLCAGSSGSHVGTVLSPFPAWAGLPNAPGAPKLGEGGTGEPGEKTWNSQSLEKRTGMPRASGSTASTAPRALLLAGMGDAGGGESIRTKALMPPGVGPAAASTAGEVAEG